MSRSQVKSSTVCGSSNTASVVSPLPKPLSLSTTGTVSPVSQVSITHESSLRITGCSTMPAALIVSAIWRTSASVVGGFSGSSPARRKWFLL